MSFPRAKIQRFNEILPITPSPAEYNVSLKNNAHGAVISKSDRFLDIKSPVSENGSASTTASTPCFRTPTLPKKKKGIFTLPGRKTKTSSTDLFNKSTSELEALKDKIVECNNKDSYISDLIEQLEEMKNKLSELEKQKQQLTDERNRFEEAANELREEHRVVLESTYLQHDREICSVKAELKKSVLELVDALKECLLLKEEKKKADVELDKYKTECLEALKGIEGMIEEKEGIIAELKERVGKLEGKISELEVGHGEKMEELRAKHRAELEDVEFAMLKSVSEMQSLLDCERKEFEKKLKKVEVEKERLVAESEARVKQIEEDGKEAMLLAEMQMQEKCKDLEMSWKIKLDEQEKQSDAILKECQAISEYSIIQCELEKKEVKMELDRTLSELSNIRKENADLVISFKELEFKCAELQEASKQHRDAESLRLELQEALHHKKVYEISISKSHDTIETLKKRLLNSDGDVEQLKAELDACERTVLEYQTKNDQLQEELRTANKQTEDLELQYDKAIEKTERLVVQLEARLLERLDEYKNKADVEIAAYKSRLEEKERDLQEVMEQLHEQQKANVKAERLILSAQMAINADKKDCRCVELDEVKKQVGQLNEKSDSYSKYCDYYKAEVAKLEREIDEMTGISKKYIEQSGKYDALLQQFEELQLKNTALERQVAEQESLIGPFREQLEAYEIERNALLCQKSEAETEAKSMGLKYAQLLGHQNQKQKIRHMVDLKSKNYELTEAKKDLEIKVKMQARTIEKLKKELASITQSPKKSKFLSTDKENVASPNRTLNNSSRVESPVMPLRDRN